MEDLIVILVKLIIRWASSSSEDAPAARRIVSAPIPVLPPPEIAKPLTPAQLQKRKTTAAAKGKPPRGSAPTRQTVSAAPQSSVAEPAQVLHPETLGTQIAAALQSRKNLATALMMTELITPPVTLRRPGSN